jgi:hypothetical protein
MDAFDLDVRHHVYASIVADGHPPTPRETADALGRDEDDLVDAYHRLHDTHALVLFPGTTDIWMANPFCFAPTPHHVHAAGRTWTATCCWDSFGILAALHVDGHVSTECACCGDRLELAVRDGDVVEGAGVLCHVLVPARRWWDDIGFT